jgi:hypothetical protein
VSVIDPPRDGEGTATRSGVVEGGAQREDQRGWRAPSTMLRMVPLPVPREDLNVVAHAATCA